MKKTIFVSFMLSVLLLTGCASQPADTMEKILTETSYEYPAEWPENRFTDCTVEAMQTLYEDIVG